MADFSSGIARYIKAVAIVEVFFPVDFKGREEIACKHCPFYIRATQRCALNQEVVNYPEYYVGRECPLVEVKDDGSVEESAVGGI